VCSSDLDAPGYVKGKPVHPTIKIGSRYRVNGEEYEPRYEPSYDQTGLASWYGPGFHGKSTANGERFNQWALTAAHKTLPMPSIVRVTHLENGKEITVRINDRGPFADGRIIDLSRAAAEELGMVEEGVAPVRVRYLKPDTERYIAKLQLDKPKAWTETDIQLAQHEAEASESLSHSPLDTLRMSELEPAAHPPVEDATDVPERFAYNAPIEQPTTVAARGVEMVEVGYAVNAFTVLSGRGGEALAFERSTYKPAPETLEPAFSGEQYFVQAGAFSLHNNAQRLSERIAALSAVDIREVDGLYRVRLGPVRDDVAAQELAHRLKAYGIQDAAVIKE